MKGISLVVGLLVASLVTPAAPAWAQSGLTLEAVQQRLDALERQNDDLREQVRLLRQELDALKPAGSPTDGSRLAAFEEKVDVQAGRLSEHDEIKVEGTQRAPIRLTGMLLVNVFRNTHHGGTSPTDYPGTAAVATVPANSGATLKQTVIGLDLHISEAILGGQFRGSALFDLIGSGDVGTRQPAVTLSNAPRLRTAWIEGRWGGRSLLFGQDKTIFSPREPNSLAQVANSPLAGSGNLYGWRPQIRFEQAVRLGERQDLRAQVAVAQTSEDWPRIQSTYASTLEAKRPALEGHVGFSRAFGSGRRVEIGSGFHRSATHVAQTSIPSRVYSVDWFVSPVARVEVSGSLFTGKNVAKFGGRRYDGFAISRPSPDVIRAVPVRSHGGWTQVAFLATSRLTLNVSGGFENPNDDDLLLADSITRNAANAASFFYRVAPNVVFGAEAYQARTWYKEGQRPRYNHYDLYMAYLF